MNPDLTALLRRLPGVDAVLSRPELTEGEEAFGRGALLEAAQEQISRLRSAILAGEVTPAALDDRLQRLPEAILVHLDRRARDPLVPVINATGILVHTNLGRAPLSARAAEAMWRAARASVALEYDLETGGRGSRTGILQAETEKLFPGQESLAVTNNAAAILLALNTLALDREVLISRGELVEIGGSFRVPDILESSGARLREVGTTNRTRAADYRKAGGSATGALLRVHPSNFRQDGFVESADAGELAGIASDLGVPYIVDQGSGNLHDLTPYGVPDEPRVQDLLQQGASLVTFSGDKLLGGPQCGLLVGDPLLVSRLRRNPLARALRPDKLILAGLVETLRSHSRGDAFTEIPVLARLSAPVEGIRTRAEAWQAHLQDHGIPPESLAVREGWSRTGGGASPEGEIPTVLLGVALGAGGGSDLAQALRRQRPAVVARCHEGRVWLDPRSVEPDADGALLEAILSAVASLH